MEGLEPSDVEGMSSTGVIDVRVVTIVTTRVSNIPTGIVTRARIRRKASRKTSMLRARLIAVHSTTVSRLTAISRPALVSTPTGISPRGDDDGAGVEDQWHKCQKKQFHQCFHSAVNARGDLISSYLPVYINIFYTKSQ